MYTWSARAPFGAVNNAHSPSLFLCALGRPHPAAPQVRGVLEKLLDDDREMADMNLTARKEEKEEQVAAAEAMRQQQQQQQALMMQQQQQQQQQEAAARAAEAQSPPLAPNAVCGRVLGG